VRLEGPAIGTAPRRCGAVGRHWDGWIYVAKLAGERGQAHWANLYRALGCVVFWRVRKKRGRIMAHGSHLDGR
jgi:hypothetical protein